MLLAPSESISLSKYSTNIRERKINMTLVKVNRIAKNFEIANHT